MTTSNSKWLILILLGGVLFQNESYAYAGNRADSLPKALSAYHQDLLEKRIRYEAQERFAVLQIPDNVKDWENYKSTNRKKILQKTGTMINPLLPLDMKETGSIKMNGYTIRNIFFQCRPGVYATANLFIPDGQGPFPAVINLHAHSGRFDDNDQAVAHALAMDGYVCLSIDPWGAGERTTIHGEPDYHGANLGASFMNIGETLMGVQVSDNMRGVDLLVSLPEVDPLNIGACGASGGGNQTMWLAAVDERIKASMPVVSVGTFESYVMRDNCICELLVDGLEFTEESGVLALVAPRAIKICSHKKDDGPAFFPSEMLRSYNNALPVFKKLGVENNLAYELFDVPHGFLKEDREAMLGWFDLHLKGKGDGKPRKEKAYHLLTEHELMVFPKGKRDSSVLTTEQYCKKRGTELRTVYLKTNSIETAKKKKELSLLLNLHEESIVKEFSSYSSSEGWDRIALKTTDNKLIPLLVTPPVNPSLGYQVLIDPRGKKHIPQQLIDELKSKGYGIALMDFSGTGEAGSELADAMDTPVFFHTQSRAELWLGKTMLGEWSKELKTVVGFLSSNYKARQINIDGCGEAGLAGLFMAALAKNSIVKSVTLRNAPVSYLFDQRKTVDFFTMGIHLPGFLNWGDISLAAGLSGIAVNFVHPVTMSGRDIDESGLKSYAAEYARVRTLCSQPGKTSFK